MNIPQLVSAIVDEIEGSYLPSRTTLGPLSTHLLHLANSYLQRYIRQYTITSVAQDRGEALTGLYFTTQRGAIVLRQSDTLNKVAIANILIYMCNSKATADEDADEEDEGSRSEWFGEYYFIPLQQLLVQLIMRIENEYGVNDRLAGFVSGYVRFFYAGSATVTPVAARIRYNHLPLMNPQMSIFPQVVTSKDSSAAVSYLVGSMSAVIDHEADGHSTTFDEVLF